MSANGFVWYELVTPDVDGGFAFYRRLLGWEGEEFPAGESRYLIVSAQGKGVGGIMPMPAGMPRPFWVGYLGTVDIDASVSRVKQAGGSVHRGPWEIPGVGRLALFSDPQGAGLAFIQGASEEKSEAFDQAKPGHGNWHELHTSNPKAALSFYSEQFGWQPGEAMDMGPMGTYQILKQGAVQIGGIMGLDDAVPQPMWLYYFGVPSAQRAIDAIKTGGGSVLHDPREVPGGAFIVTAKDPQGALFAIVGPK